MISLTPPMIAFAICPVDCLWNPPPAALDLCRRVELILPVCEKLAAVV
jgi:hypothetical protein